MADNFEESIILSEGDLDMFEKDNIEGITDIMKMGDHYLIKHKPKFMEDQTRVNGLNETHNINIAVASAITGYARIEMSKFKNNPDYILYYSDTDSIFINKPLPDHMVSDTELGFMKLEYIVEEGIFLAPKVYCLKFADGSIKYRVKGLKSDVNLTFEDFRALLKKDSVIEKNQSKWYRSLENGNIVIKDLLYQPKVTSSKWNLIYNKDNIFICTEPIYLTLSEEDKKPYI